MGAAKRRKDLGIMPEPTQKPRKRARARIDHSIGMMGMLGMETILASLLMSKSLSRNFVMRSELARINRELDRPSEHQSTESA